MDGLKITWTQAAINQRANVFNYWNNRNGNKKYSSKLNRGIRTRLELLKTNPKLGVETTRKDFRVLYYLNYGIHYKTAKTSLFIVGFWDNRQNPEKLLQLLKSS